MVRKEVELGNWESLNEATELVIQRCNEYFQKEVLLPVEEEQLYGVLLRCSLLYQASWESLELGDVEMQIPFYISLIKRWMPYKHHLRLVIEILLHFSVIPNVGKDFIHEKFDFIPSIEEVFTAYPYSEEDIDMIVESHWLLGNLCADSIQVRDKFLESKFLEHISYLLTDKEIKLYSESIKNLAYVIKCYLSQKVYSMHKVEKFEWLVDPLKALLFVKSIETIDYAILSIAYILENANSNSRIFTDLCWDEVMRKIIEIGLENSKSSLKNVLRAVWNMISGPKKNVKKLIEFNLIDLIVDSKLDITLNVDNEVLKWLYNLTLWDQEILNELYEEKAFAIISSSLSSNKSTLQEMALKWVINLIKTADNSLVDRLIEDGYIMQIKELLNKITHQNIIFWVVSAIYVFLEKDTKDKNYTLYFQEIKGIDALEDIEMHVSNDIYDKIKEIYTDFLEGEPEQSGLDVCDMRDQMPARLHISNEMAF